MISYNLRKTVCSAVIFTAMILWSFSAMAAMVDLPDGSKLDTTAICPVCNMKVDSNPVGTAAVVFKDGKVVPFDGPGDLFKYLLDPKKYGFDSANIKGIFVTDYGSKKFVDGKGAFFVVGSEVKGLMGSDPLPFAKKMMPKSSRLITKVRRCSRLQR